MAQPTTSASPSSSPLERLWAMLGGRSGGSILGLCVLAGTALGLLVVPRAPRPPSVPDAPPVLSFLGQTLGGKSDEPDPTRAAQDEAQLLARQLLEKPFTVTVPGERSLVLPLSKWGVSVDETRLDRLIGDSLDPTSPQAEVFAATVQHGKQALPARALPIVVEIDRDRAAEQLAALKAAIDRPASSAKYDVRSGKIVPHRDGLALDVVGTILALREAVMDGKDKVDARLVITAPHRKAEELAQLAFPKVLGHFDTRYSPSEKYRDRTYNLRLAAQTLDGTVLFPGEVFDFNSVVGPRDEAHGYRVATVIEDGELVDGIGGGTCQISGTLHGAAFFSGLEILERYPHTRPSSYIKMGMDATVVYPTINFRFRNGFDFPIVVHQRVEGGKVYAEVRGGHVDQVISLIRKIDSAIPYEEVERPDPQLPKGSRVLAQRGIPGFHLHRYRVVRRGSHTRRDKWRDVYPPTAQVVRVGTGPNDASVKAPSGTNTPEYTADEVLVLTLKRASDGSPGEFAENREPGRFGESGWTRQANMPFWNGG